MYVALIISIGNIGQHSVNMSARLKEEIHCSASNTKSADSTNNSAEWSKICLWENYFIIYRKDLVTENELHASILGNFYLATLC